MARKPALGWGFCAAMDISHAWMQCILRAGVGAAADAFLLLCRYDTEQTMLLSEEPGGGYLAA